MRIEKLQEEIDNAILNYKLNKESGSPAESLAFDAGRIDGLKTAMGIVERTFQEANN